MSTGPTPDIDRLVDLVVAWRDARQAGDLFAAFRVARALDDARDEAMIDLMQAIASKGHTWDDIAAAVGLKDGRTAWIELQQDYGLWGPPPPA